MQNKPLKTNQLNYDNLRLVKKDNKTLIKYNNNNSNGRFLVQPPSLICDKVNSIGDNYELIIRIKSDKNLESFYNFIYSLQKFVSDNFSSNMVQKNIIRYNEDYPEGYMKLKIKKNYIGTLTKVTKNKQTEEVDLSNVKCPYKVKMILEPIGIWENSTSYGIYMKPVLLDFTEIEQEISFIESETEEEDDILDTEVDNTETSLNLNNTMSLNNTETSFNNTMSLNNTETFQLSSKIDNDSEHFKSIKLEFNNNEYSDTSDDNIENTDFQTETSVVDTINVIEKYDNS